MTVASGASYKYTYLLTYLHVVTWQAADGASPKCTSREYCLKILAHGATKMNINIMMEW